MFGRVRPNYLNAPVQTKSIESESTSTLKQVLKYSTVDQLMFAAIKVRALANQSVLPAINVCDLGSQ